MIGFSSSCVVSHPYTDMFTLTFQSNWPHSVGTHHPYSCSFRHLHCHPHLVHGLSYALPSALYYQLFHPESLFHFLCLSSLSTTIHAQPSVPCSPYFCQTLTLLGFAWLASHFFCVSFSVAVAGAVDGAYDKYHAILFCSLPMYVPFNIFVTTGFSLSLIFELRK